MCITIITEEQKTMNLRRSERDTKSWKEERELESNINFIYKILKKNKLNKNLGERYAVI